MIKMGIFNKINDVLVVDTFKNIFQRRIMNTVLWCYTWKYVNL